MLPKTFFRDFNKKKILFNKINHTQISKNQSLTNKISNCEIMLKWSKKSIFFFQAEDGIRDQPRSRGLGDVYKRQFQYWFQVRVREMAE